MPLFVCLSIAPWSRALPTIEMPSAIAAMIPAVPGAFAAPMPVRSARTVGAAGHDAARAEIDDPTAAAPSAVAMVAPSLCQLDHRCCRWSSRFSWQGSRLRRRYTGEKDRCRAHDLSHVRSLQALLLGQKRERLSLVPATVEGWTACGCADADETVTRFASRDNRRPGGAARRTRSRPTASRNR